MTTLEQLRQLNRLLLADMPQYQSQAAQFPQTHQAQWRLFRSLVNIRKPGPIGDDFLTLQDSFLQRETAAKGITDLADLSPMEDGIYLWQGDITTLRIDAIVNAANSGLTGCYCPCHGCIDNAIHTFAGVQLRQECAKLMQKQGHPEPTGQAKITKAYNLPCRHVIHTVGPIVRGPLTDRHRQQLACCYRACLELAEEKGLKSIAFCCISTGEFHFPNEEAAQIAVHEVRAYRKNGGGCSVVFNVFKDEDWEIYKAYLCSCPMP